MSATDFEGLISRLEAAEVGSRDLDVLVAMTLEPETAQPSGGWLWYTTTGYVESINPRPSTTSLDAALALAERVLPDWKWELSWGSDDAWASCAPEFWRPHHGQDASDAGGFEVTAKTRPLAICIATLRAKAAGR